MKATFSNGTFTTADTWNTDNFKLVETFPNGAIVWNIGRHNFPFPGYIPVAYPIGDYRINRSRLMAVKCKDEKTADIILKRAGKGTINKETFLELNK